MNGIPIGECNYYNEGNNIVEIGIKRCDHTKQEKGIGRIVLCMLINSLFNDHGYEKIILNTNLNNTRTQHVYELFGFKRLRVNYNSWNDQLGNPQTYVDYELVKNDFIDHIK
ncbi:MAG: GNAT family protein [Ruminococcus sp.]